MILDPYTTQDQEQELEQLQFEQPYPPGSAVSFSSSRYHHPHRQRQRRTSSLLRRCLPNCSMFKGVILLFGCSLLVWNIQYNLQLTARILPYEDKDVEDPTAASSAASASSAVSVSNIPLVSNVTSGTINTHDAILEELDELSDGAHARRRPCPAPLRPFENILQKSSDARPASSQVIPKIVHVSYRSRCLPRDIAENLRLWSVALPSYSIILYDDAAVHKLLYGGATTDTDADTDAKQHQPWILDLFGHEFYDALQCVRYQGAMTIDVWRILLLYKYGGIYTDADNTPLVPTFTETYPLFQHTANHDHETSSIPNLQQKVSFFVYADVHQRLSHWFFACEPHHPIMVLAMQRIIHNLQTLPDITKPKVMQTTGPDTLKYAYQEFLKVAPTTTMGSTTTDTKQEYKTKLEQEFKQKLQQIRRESMADAAQRQLLQQPTNITTPPAKMKGGQYHRRLSSRRDRYDRNDELLLGYQNKQVYKKSNFRDTIVPNSKYKAEELVPYYYYDQSINTTTTANTTTATTTPHESLLMKNITRASRIKLDRQLLAAFELETTNDTKINKRKNPKDDGAVPKIRHWTEARIYGAKEMRKLFRRYNISRTCQGYNEQLKEGNGRVPEQAQRMY